ncbi:DUF1559 domain-containing protein [Lacipirellula parvula]|uniref:DUF1559 domain-containing protein n=1 Tax=Lacipirellula parvula TaxID=2650471 RepID=A0A5K7X4J6_9BACT|nr:DUF1559 domain-containing protein [Lacipirellula parvula]BBO30732.1 hypothetical protein PLANPX_0344 [Lacipirellula parvula]
MSRRITFARASGFTLVELLVVIAIIGVLVALLLPAVQAAREASRMSSCRNNIKQLSLAMAMHESTHKCLPSSGWLGDWTGDPNAGATTGQPGGWVYNILPFIEQSAVHQIGKGMTGVDLKKELARRDAMPIGFLNCPTRRPSIAYPNVYNKVAINGRYAEFHARSDYAANAGDIAQLETWCELHVPKAFDAAKQLNWRPNIDWHNGIGYCGAIIQFRHITDGTSNTYAVGERFLEPEASLRGEAKADDWPMYNGFQDDLMRSVYYDPAFPDKAQIPKPDVDGVEDSYRFGSSHPSGLNMGMCDGSVTTISFDIDPEVHRRSGHRSDEGGPRQPDHDPKLP